MYSGAWGTNFNNYLVDSFIQAIHENKQVTFDFQLSDNKIENIKNKIFNKVSITLNKPKIIKMKMDKNY